MKKWQGYVSSRSVNGSIIPQRVQNLVIREFVKQQGHEYHLSGTEYGIENCFVFLWGMIKKFPKEIDGIVFYSLHMLPFEKEQRDKLFEQAFKTKCSISFALEAIIVENSKDRQVIENIMDTLLSINQSTPNRLKLHQYLT